MSRIQPLSHKKHRGRGTCTRRTTVSIGRGSIRSVISRSLDHTIGTASTSRIRRRTHYRLVVTKIHPGNTQGYLGISNLRFFEAATGAGAADIGEIAGAREFGDGEGSSLFAGTAWSLNFEHDRPLVKYPEVLSAAVADDRFRGYTATRSSNRRCTVSRCVRAYDGNDVSTWATDYNYNTTTGPLALRLLLRVRTVIGIS